MMPSHSMDLPVPRGTSMLMQDGKFTPNGTKSELQMCPVCITCSKYVSMRNSCFSSDGKFPFCFLARPCAIILNSVCFVGLLMELNTVIFVLICCACC